MSLSSRNEIKETETTQYLVNDIECKKADIYQMILDNKLYNAPQITIKKTHTSESHVDEVVEDERLCLFSAMVQKMLAPVENKNSRHFEYSLETKKFTDKFPAESQEYKNLITKMIILVEKGYDAIVQYNNQRSNALRASVKDCLRYFIEKTEKVTSQFDHLLKDISMEIFAFQADVSAFNVSNNSKTKTHKTFLLTFDMSGMNESWQNDWSNQKKSDFIFKYLSTLQTQIEVIFKSWIDDNLLPDEYLRVDVERKVNAFKNTLLDFDIQRSKLDKSLNYSLADSISAFFGLSSKKPSLSQHKPAQEFARTQSL